MSELVPASSGALRAATPAANWRLSMLGVMSQPAVQRALPAMGGIAALLVAGTAWYSFQSPGQRAVFEGLGDADKAAIADALQAAGMTHSVDRSTGSVTVPDSDFYKARMLLASQGLPKAAPSGDAMLSALPMGASRAVEGETLRGARESDLSRTIEAIDAVKKARVHLSIPEPSPFLRDATPAGASVMLTLQTGRSIGDAQVRAIGHLVASAVPGLTADNVSIVDQSGALFAQPDAGDDRILAQQAAIEDRARKAVTALLGQMVGPDNYTAEIHADLDPTESQSTRESYPKDDRALRREEGNRTSSSNSAPPAIGIPGALANQPPPASQVANAPGGALTMPAPAAGTPAVGGSGDETYVRAFDVGREISVTHQPTGRLKRLSVAVALRDVKGSKPRSAQELATLEKLVKSAVGFDATRGDVVAIASRPFVDPAPVADVAFYDRPIFMTVVRQVGAVLGALLAFFLIGRPLMRAFKRRAERTAEEGTIAQSLLSATAQRAPVTLDMIESEPSYEARANLVRQFVRQDAAKATDVVRQLMANTRNA